MLIKQTEPPNDTEVQEKEIYQNQLLFNLTKHIFIAGTEYINRNFLNPTLCPEGIWLHLLEAIDEIDHSFISEFAQYQDQQQKQEESKDDITSKNVSKIIEGIIPKLREVVEQKPELKQAFMDFVTRDSDIDYSENISIEAQPIFAIINQCLNTQKIQDALPNYSKSTPTFKEYQIITAGIINSPMLSSFRVIQEYIEECRKEQPTHTPDIQESASVSATTSKRAYQPQEIAQDESGVPVIKKPKLEEVMNSSPSTVAFIQEKDIRRKVKMDTKQPINKGLQGSGSQGMNL